jgi:hypothetical protein
MARLGRLWRENWLTLVVLAALAVGYAVLRTPASDLGSPEQVAERLSQGKPTVLYFYSNT